MRRKKRKGKDEAQSSLDAFTQPTEATPTVDEPTVPAMPDLDLLEAAEAKIDEEKQPQIAPKTSSTGPRSFAMPSTSIALSLIHI